MSHKRKKNRKGFLAWITYNFGICYFSTSMALEAVHKLKPCLHAKYDFPVFKNVSCFNEEHNTNFYVHTF